MTMTAVTAASWATQGPMKCAPGTVTEGCCWWGRGAIQTTGPNNYGALNKEVMQKIPTLQDRGIDICTNPEALCQHQDTKWLGAVFYWANNVQGFTDSRVAAMFHESLDKFVESGFLNSASVVSGSDFPTGTGGLVNNGFWTAAAHKNANRVAYFNKIMRLFKDAGMTVDGGENGSGATSPPNDDNGGGEDAATPSSTTTSTGSATSPAATVPTDGGSSTTGGVTDSSPPSSSSSCPPAGWNRCTDTSSGKMRWPPPADGYCCSTAGYLGLSAAHCTGGLNALDKCCKLEGGKISCGDMDGAGSGSSTASTTAAPSKPGASNGGGGSPTTSDCTVAWAKCGGKGWTGATCCKSGLQCVVSNPWYSQCKPAAVPPAPIPPTTTTPSAPIDPADTTKTTMTTTTTTVYAKRWAKCGGKGWTGATVCEPESTCIAGNVWYHQCQPAQHVPTAAALELAEASLVQSHLFQEAKSSAVTNDQSEMGVTTATATSDAATLQSAGLALILAAATMAGM